ncbi:MULTISPECIES: DNA mismatch repair endonuclease MutL [Ferrimonas]|uniref:DNA mismatch repair endonuclease MutL n=1 Tax=Ferrimonas TaxID=44011 RepID=UPI000402473D|nr:MULTISPECIES: DNA mismatch repair endonuclease MutL [Ferrimonas]USD37096.1 DNA mismatch repair endonuclease MutL [Ferrimonas sp. SCSIO 43195]
MTIQILPAQLANQIAAGEVVERPASVVKELVENCLDAGASRVDVEIERGGSKRILVRDNGLGIDKQELALALSRHATSKVASLEDLESILSFGFRGEALASISSVSRLTLTSKTQAQSEAWQAYAEGQEMAVKVQPAAHPVGTTVLVEDLFFNTPARRRFLRADKTEFNHIDEQLRRIALAKPTIHFTLSHNGKLVRQYRAARTDKQHQQRLGAICSHRFAEAAVTLSTGNEQLQLHGCLAIGDGHQGFSDVQYFYVNGRVVRDRLVNHALRQALEMHGQNSDAGYVLHLDLPPQEVDVNVHPAKHEVRFHQARYVHDFILQGLSDAVSQLAGAKATGVDGEPAPFQPAPLTVSSHSTPAPVAGSTAVARSAVHSQPGQSREPAAAYTPPPLQPRPRVEAVTNYGDLMQAAEVTPSGRDSVEADWHWLTQLDETHALIGKGDQLRLLPLVALLRCGGQQQLLDRLPQGLVSQPLLLPVSVARLPDWEPVLRQQQGLLKRLGFELAEQKQRLIIRKVPSVLRQANLAQIVPELLQWLLSCPQGGAPEPEAMTAWLADHGDFSAAAADVWQQLQRSAPERITLLIQTQAVTLNWRTALEQ